ncbi:MAG: DUF6048 family protein [Bacteroidota bacterium]
MSRFISSLLLFGISLTLFGQRAMDPELEEEVDFTPRDFSVAYNLVNAGTSLLNANRNTHEIQFSSTLYRYLLVIDFGTDDHQRGELTDYTTTGQYFRAGIDRNFVNDISSGNVLALGIRYARSYFENELNHTLVQSIGEASINYQNDELKARWFELNVNLRGKIVSNLYAGFTLRWQTFRKLRGEGTLTAFEIPGFGTTRRNNSTAFDYYIMWRIPFRE